MCSTFKDPTSREVTYQRYQDFYLVTDDFWEQFCIHTQVISNQTFICLFVCSFILISLPSIKFPEGLIFLNTDWFRISSCPICMAHSLLKRSYSHYLSFHFHNYLPVPLKDLFFPSHGLNSLHWASDTLIQT